jgi:hypothetical protein
MKKNVKTDSAGVHEALRATRLPARRPTDEDRPPPQSLPGPKRKPLPGQMGLGEVIDDAA